MRETCRNTTGDDVDATNAQGLQAIGRADGETASLGQRRRIRAAAGAQVFFENADRPGIGANPADHHRIVEVGDVQHQVRGAGVAVGIGQGVGESLGAMPATMEIDEVRIRRVQGVGVGAIGRQHQGAVGAGEGARDDRIGSTVRTLDIVGQHVAGQHGRGFGSDRGIGIVHRPRYIVDDGDIEAAAGDIAIAVTGRDRNAFAQRRAGSGQGVAVTDGAAGRVVAGDGQDIAGAGGDGLPYASDHAPSQHIQAADIEVEHTIRRDHGKGADLCQGSRVACRALGQIGFVDGDLAALHRQAFEADRVVHRQGQLVVDQVADPQFRQLAQEIEARRGEADDRIDMAAHLGQQHEAVAAPQRTGRAVTGAGRRGLGVLGRVGAGGDGLLKPFDVSQLSLARGDDVRRLHMGSVVVQQIVGKGQAALAAQGQFTAIGQVNRHGSRRSGFQLLPGKYPVAFPEHSPGAIGSHREHFTDHLADYTDCLSHVPTPPLP